MDWILVKIFRLRKFALHSVNQHGQKMTWYVYSYDGAHITRNGEIEIHDWTDYV